MKYLKPFFIALSLNLVFLQVSAQDRLPAFEMNERLGKGVNMGNAFEAPTETAWGNPWKAEYFEIMADLGFNHVRLPVRWETTERSMANAPYTISQTFLQRIKEVVDAALENDLHIIVNMHHHDALFENPEGQKERFLSQWNQIATYFKDYPDMLLFEVLNEPHGNLSPELWNEFFADALAEIRKTNPTRVVILGVAEFGGLGGIVHLQLPDDEYIILSPHYYNPFNFTHQGAEWVENSDPWLGTEWLDTEADRETVVNEFSFALQFSETNHIPIHVGEFGAYSKADIESRERWTTFLARWFEEQGLSWAYWEFSAGFGIYNPTTKQLNEPLFDALFNNEMPDPVPITATPVYTSNFSSGTDGWALNTQGGAAGSVSASGGKLVVNLTNGGTEGWHAQLVKNNISLVKDKMYRISFKAQAQENRSATFYAGKASDPWNAYSGYNGINISTGESNFVFSFTMTSPTDPAARLVFDLGKSASGISISEIKVEQIVIGTPVVTSIEEPGFGRELKLYPNPVKNILHIHALHSYRTAELYDLNGRAVARYEVPSAANQTIDMRHLPQGIYMLKLTGNGLEERAKIVKE
jgi:aryl-phospho-beta-D-glucosidase BglC (GH1 family)